MAPAPSASPSSGAGRFVRLAEAARPVLTFRFDGEELRALEGDSVLSAILLSARSLRQSDCGPEGRAGFCLMGACQDCWIWREDGTRLRACSTPIEPGMALRSTAPELWPELPR